MAFFDLPLEKLKKYCPERDEPADFDEFWFETLQEAYQFPLHLVFERVVFGIKTLDVYDASSG